MTNEEKCFIKINIKKDSVYSITYYKKVYLISYYHEVYYPYFLGNYIFKIEDKMVY